MVILLLLLLLLLSRRVRLCANTITACPTVMMLNLVVTDVSFLDGVAERTWRSKVASCILLSQCAVKLFIMMSPSVLFSLQAQPIGACVNQCCTLYTRNRPLWMWICVFAAVTHSSGVHLSASLVWGSSYAQLDRILCWVVMLVNIMQSSMGIRTVTGVCQSPGPGSSQHWIEEPSQSLHPKEL